MSRRTFIQQTGPDTGRQVAVEEGRSTVGRGETAVICLPHPSVSKTHAVVIAADGRVTVADHDSTNGTLINGTPATGQPLNDGDVVEFGAIAMQYQATPQTNGASVAMCRDQTTNREYYRLGSVAGPAQAGSGTQYNVGRDMHQTDLRGDHQFGDHFGGGNVSGGDQRIGHHFGDINVGHDGEMDELFQGKGIGRVLMLVGLISIIVGFSLFAFTIFSFFGDLQSGIAGEDPFADSSRQPFDTTLAGIPTLPLGFGLFFLGGIVATIGQGLSRSARRRTDGPAAVRPIEKRRRR